MIKRIYIFILLMVFIANYGYANAEDKAQQKFFDQMEAQAFGYFWNETDPRTGLTSNTTEAGSPASNAASGFMLSSLLIGIERGWITRDEGYQRALITLKTYKEMENHKGFNYHYFTPRSGQRMWMSEVSCIDTALFLSGVITVGEYFKGTEAEKLADDIFRQTDWQWFLDGENVLQMSWRPERGFVARIDRFSEGILCYILAMGSPTHPIPAKCWDSFTRPVTKYGGYELIYVADGSLFQYLFPMAWLDLKDKHDAYADYWQNAISAIKANKEYCCENANRYKTFREGFWGLSASLSPHGYKVFGAKPGNNLTDGTVAPYAVGASIPLTPEFSIADYRKMYKSVPGVVKKYGLVDAFNIDANWASDDYVSIDIGVMLLMVENYRTGLIWKYFMRNEYVKKGMSAAGFGPGCQGAPTKLKNIPGNPDDSIIVRRISAPVKIDADLSKWAGSSSITLTAQNNRNVEITQGYVRDDSDVSGKFYLGWDDKRFYIAGHVKDDQIVCTQRGDKIYLDDCVEIYFDTDINGFYFDKNPNDYQFGIAPTGPDKVGQIWEWGYRNCVPANVEYAVKETSDGYDIEMAIPFSELGNFSPGNPDGTLFSISIHDRDKNGKAKKLTWSVDSASNPDKIIFGKLTLQ